VAALQVHVSTLRKAIGDRLGTTPSGYVLTVAAQEIDAARFESAIGDVPGESPVDRVRRLGEALSWWRGEPYEDVPAGPDVQAVRQRLADLRITATEDLARAELALGRHADVANRLSGLVVRHPTRERMVGLLMLALYRSGRIDEAHEACRRLRGHLDAELGVAPGEEISALDRAIARRDPTLLPPPVIPTAPSRFIGRRDELDRIADRLGTTRLLTVTGPGGMGKTRLAAELARELASDHPDGTEVVELAALPAGDSVRDRLAARFGVPTMPALLDHVRDRRMLIVFDNCEHVIDSCAAVVAELLAGCGGLRVLATSREPLGVPGEVVWPLGGLRPHDSHRLLIDRATCARPTLRADARTVARLCAQLEGVPLAIELAAAQVRGRSLGEVASLLDRRLDLRDSRSRTTSDRHRTMRTAIDWSHDLLSPDERRLFRRLAVFAGGCPPAVAERVCGASHDLVVRLVDRSLLSYESSRLRMLELVREYAGERLAESGEGPELRREHAVWCTELAASTANYGSTDHAELVRLLDTELANLRAAMEWCVAEEPLRALMIASPLWWYWWARGLMADGLRWLSKALDASDPIPVPLRASALRAAAALSRNSGDYDTALDYGRQCLAVCEQLGDETGMIFAYGGLCITALAQRDYPGALHYGERSRALAERAGDEQRWASALNNIGLTLRSMGRLDEAAATFQAALPHWRAVNDLRGEASTGGNLGITARRRGDADESRRLCLDALRRYQDLDLTDGVLDMITALGCLEVDAGRFEAGLRLLGVVRRERERLGTPVFVEDEIADEAAAFAAAEAAVGPLQPDDVELSVVVHGLLDEW
jgi:predicted ATPase/DNA-binding SARP family transcriptional activator